MSAGFSICMGKSRANQLTHRQRAFVENYLMCWNASEALRRAGYKGKNADVIAAQNLVKPSIRSAIEARLAEMSMGANEVLMRLGEHARNDGAEYVTVGENKKPALDIERMIRDGKQRLIKGITYSRSGDVIVELYDAQSALVHLGRHHKLFTDKVEESGKGEWILRVINGGDDVDDDSTKR